VESQLLGASQHLNPALDIRFISQDQGCRVFCKKAFRKQIYTMLSFTNDTGDMVYVYVFVCVYLSVRACVCAAHACTCNKINRAPRYKGGATNLKMRGGSMY